MSRIAFAAVALTAAGFTGSAQAADLYGSRPNYYNSNPPPLDRTWIGPYLGGNIGYAWGSVDNNPTKPSGFVGGVRPATIGGSVHRVSGSSASKATSRRLAPTRRFRALEIFQSVVRHGARPGGLSLHQQFSCLRHRRPRVRRIARRDLRAVGNPYQCGMDRGRRRRIPFRPAMEREGGIPLCRSRQAATSPSPAHPTVTVSACCAPASTDHF